MSAATFVGRVGGLAIALGIGVASYSGVGIAFADNGTGSASDGAGNAGQASRPAAHSGRGAASHAGAQSDASGSGVTGRGRGTAAAAKAIGVPQAAPSNDAGASPSPIPESAVPQSVPQSFPAAAASKPAPAPAAPAAATPVKTNSVVAQSIAVPAAVVATSVAAVATPVAAPAAAVAGVVTATQSGGGGPLAAPGTLLPADSPLSWAVLALARRQPLASATGSQPAAQVTASSIFDNHITANPEVVWGGTLTTNLGSVALPGVLTGFVNAVSSQGLEMAYTVLRKPDAGGKIGGGPLLPLTNFYGTNGGFSYLPYSTTLTDSTKTEQFTIQAMELSKVDQFFIKLLGPAGKLVVTQVVGGLHRIPLIGDLLSPIIGQAKNVVFDVNPDDLAAQRPTAFTYKMPSFDGTLISVNYFPATNVAKGLVTDAPTVLAASGLACAANTDPTTRFGQLFPSNQFGSLTPGIAPLRDDAFKAAALGGLEYDGGGGYNVITWDPRGEFASGGQLQIDNPMFEGRDVSAIISWLTGATNPAANQVKTDNTGDPLVGMTGGSYGGGIQLTTVDPRIDGITPEIGWNSLLSSLYPGGVFKTGWGSILAAALAFTGARINPAIYQGIFTGALFGFLSPSSQAVLASVGPTALLSKEQAPTMIFQGIHDTLFPLNQSVANGQTIQTSPADPTLKMFWFCGGHGDCDVTKPLEQDQYGIIQNLMWMDQYVAKSGIPATDKIRTFQWFDQKGLYYNSDVLPWDPAFNQGSYTIPTAKGGFLGIWPILGGSGPAPIGDLPFSIVNAGKARNALNVKVTPPAGEQVVGAPTISFTYSGLGTASAVYAQLVDNTSGLVLSNIATPIPVTLDGKTHTVSMSMEDVAYSADAGDSLTLQITSSAINYEKFWGYGGINISDIDLTLPQHTTVAPVPFVP
jgi:ABC-2 type transport system ATP-binding protein